MERHIHLGWVREGEDGKIAAVDKICFCETVFVFLSFAVHIAYYGHTNLEGISPFFLNL